MDNQQKYRSPITPITIIAMIIGTTIIVVNSYAKTWFGIDLGIFKDVIYWATTAAMVLTAMTQAWKVANENQKIQRAREVAKLEYKNEVIDILGAAKPKLSDDDIFLLNETVNKRAAEGWELVSTSYSAPEIAQILLSFKKEK